MDTNLSSHRASAIIVAVGQYDDPIYEELNEAPKAAQELSDVLVNGGYQHAYPKLLQGGEKETISPIVKKWLQDASEKDTLLLYWAGHGKSDIDGHYLIARNSPGKNLDGENALFTSTLGKMVANSLAEKVLVLLDTCYSGAGAVDIAGTISKVLAARSPIPGVERAFAIIASAHPLKKAQEAVFCRALTALLAKGDKTRRWTDNDKFIHTSDLTLALQDMLGEELGYKADRANQRFVPNPRYRGALPAEDVETQRLRLTMAEAKEHFLPASRGIDIGSSGWYFTGRERLLIELVNWLKDAENGMVIVTGPAGSGKSAVMGRVAILSDPHYRKIAESEQALLGVPIKTLPPEGIIDVAVHAKGKTLADCVGSIAAALDITLSEGERTDPVALIEAIGGLNERITIIVDALDEAKPGHHYPIGERLLRPLSLLSQVRVLVGTRRSPDGVTIPESEPRNARLQGLFGKNARILDLKDEPNTEEDIDEYVRCRLMDSRHRDDPAGVDRISRAVGSKAAGIFLYARVVTRTLEAVENLDEKLPADAPKAFVNDITRRFGDRAEMVDEMLCALAWGEGKGLSRRVWATAANALSKTGAQYTDGDVTWMLEHAGWHIIEAGEEGQAVYRLPHQALADYYRNRFEELDANSLITRALSEGIAGEDWLNADPYLWRHLASHAAIAGLLDPLVTDPGYLAVADPTKLVPVLSKVTKANVQDIANIYRRVANQLYPVDHLERMALIHLTAKQEHPVLSNVVEPPIATAWRCRWAAWMQTAPHLVLSGHILPIKAVAIGLVGKIPVVVSGGLGQTVHLWDARTGRPLGEPLPGHKDCVNSVALGEVEGVPVVVSGSSDKTVRLWDARTGQAFGEPLTGHEDYVWAVTIGQVEGVPVVVSGSSDKTVRLWDARTGQAICEPLTRHKYAVRSVAIGKVEIKPVVVSGSADGTVQLWDVRSGEPFLGPYRDHETKIVAVAIGQVDGVPIVVSASDDNTVHVWEALTAELICEPLVHHSGQIRSVAFGQVDNRPVVASGISDGKVQLWDVYSGMPLRNPFSGHEDQVWSVAFGQVDNRPVVASGSSDRTVRLWDASSDTILSKNFTHHINWVMSVATGQLDTVSVVVSGSADGEVCLWDTRTGKVFVRPLTGHEYAVRAVAIGQVESIPVVVSGGEDQTVRLWDARTGQAFGKPLTGHKHAVRAVAIGQVESIPVVVSGADDQTVRLWDARTGQAFGKPLTGHKDVVRAVAIGQVESIPVVVSGGEDNTVRLWDARTGQAFGKPLTGHRSLVIAVDFGHIDGIPMLVSGSYDQTIRRWDARSGSQIGEPLNGHELNLTAVVYGQLAGIPIILSGSYDGTVHLWDARTGQCLRVIPSLRSAITGLAITGDTAIAVSTKGGLLLLDIA